MPVERRLPTTDAHHVIARGVADEHLAPQVAHHEHNDSCPVDTFAAPARADLLSPPYSRAQGGGGQPYEVYLQVLEELTKRRVAVSRTPLRVCRWPFTAARPSERARFRTGHARGATARRLRHLRAARRIRDPVRLQRRQGR